MKILCASPSHCEFLAVPARGAPAILRPFRLRQRFPVQTAASSSPRRLKCVSSRTSSRPSRFWLPYRHRQPRTQTRKTGARSVPPCLSGWATKAARRVGIRPSGVIGEAIGGGVRACPIDDLVPHGSASPSSAAWRRAGRLGSGWGTAEASTTRLRTTSPAPSSGSMLTRFSPATPCYYYCCSSPAIAPLVQVAIVPETIDRKPSSVISRRRSGTIAPSPPTRIPSEPKFAKPQSA